MLVVLSRAELGAGIANRSFRVGGGFQILDLVTSSDRGLPSLGDREPCI